MRKIQDINDLKGKKVLVRVGYDVPLRAGKVQDDERVRASLKTIKYLIEGNAVVVLCSHLGRPGGKKSAEFSLAPVATVLSDLLDQEVDFFEDCVGEKRQQKIGKMEPGQVLLLENLRYYEGEESGDEKFAASLAEGFDLYINEAFSNAHRAHASVVGVTKLLPSYAGFQFQEEVEGLSRLLDNPKKPFVVVSGGAKVSDKIEILKSLIKKSDVLIVGGGMANTFLLSEGYEVGKSLVEEDQLESAEEIVRAAEEGGAEVMLPDDVMVAKKVADKTSAKAKSLEEIEKDEIIVDIGPKSVAKFAEPLKFAGTIFWNGPMGIAEYKNFAKGTEGVAKIISEARGYSAIGGGDTLGALKDYGNVKFDFVSTAGGATLEFLANGTLPAIEALK